MPSDDILDDIDFSEEGLPLHPEEGEVVAKYFSLFEAEVSAARLRSEGIDCQLINAYSATINPHLQGVISIHVRPLQAALAREILQESLVDTVRVPSSKHNFWFWFVIALIVGATMAAMMVQCRNNFWEADSLPM